MKFSSYIYNGAYDLFKKLKNPFFWLSLFIIIIIGVYSCTREVNDVPFDNTEIKTDTL